ncbi:MAG: inositol-3-phosphate synthase [Bacteroidales bacterium]|nr:inositol-3-phosphate synthase [Bacteroidales bacterium]
MAERRIGLWLIGAFGGVGGTTALGLAALAQGRASTNGLVTALPQFADVPFDSFDAFVIGGHDIRQSSLTRSVAELHTRSNVFSENLIRECSPLLDAWSQNVRPGVVYRPDAVTAAMADRPDLRPAATPREAIERIRADLRAFQKAHQLDQIVVANVASTEPPFDLNEEHQNLDALVAALDRSTPAALPVSSQYAFAALDAGFAYLNLTPSRGASLPALQELARKRKVPHAGQDLKTGETLLKSTLAPMFAHRNLKILSWVGHNILGNRDGQVLNDPHNKASKIRTKDALLAELLGYRPQSLVSIEYIESLDDWKTAWDHIHFEGFLGTKMTMQLTWQGCDSVLAAPLVIDLARLLALAQRRGEAGSVPALASFFKSPIGVPEHDFGRQFDLLVKYLSI